MVPGERTEALVVVRCRCLITVGAPSAWTRGGGADRHALASQRPRGRWPCWRSPWPCSRASPRSRPASTTCRRGPCPWPASSATRTATSAPRCPGPRGGICRPRSTGCLGAGRAGTRGAAGGGRRSSCWRPCWPCRPWPGASAVTGGRSTTPRVVHRARPRAAPAARWCCRGRRLPRLRLERPARRPRPGTAVLPRRRPDRRPGTASATRARRPRTHLLRRRTTRPRLRRPGGRTAPARRPQRAGGEGQRRRPGRARRARCCTTATDWRCTTSDRRRRARPGRPSDERQRAVRRRRRDRRSCRGSPRLA